MLILCNDSLFPPGFCLVLLTSRQLSNTAAETEAISSIFRQVLARNPINPASDSQVLVLKACTTMFAPEIFCYIWKLGCVAIPPK